MPRAKCPVCGARIEIGEDVEEGDIIECPGCGSKLVVSKKGRRISLEPLEEEGETEEESEENYLEEEEEY